MNRTIKAVEEKSWLGKLWDRTVNIATMYTGTFIVVMFLNQLLFFGFCLNPICLVAAMPHVLFITAVVGSWINKENGWGDTSQKSKKTAKEKNEKQKKKKKKKKQKKEKEKKKLQKEAEKTAPNDDGIKNIILEKEDVELWLDEVEDISRNTGNTRTADISQTSKAVKKLQNSIGNSNKYPSITITKKTKDI